VPHVRAPRRTRPPRIVVDGGSVVLPPSLAADTFEGMRHGKPPLSLAVDLNLGRLWSLVGSVGAAGQSSDDLLRLRRVLLASCWPSRADALGP
jgi:hypothetical protein